MSLFKRRRFPVEIILLCVRWYCKYGISYRDLAEMMSERGVSVGPSTIFRWVQRYAPEIEKRIRPIPGTSFRLMAVDETYVRVGGKWRYLFRAVDKHGQLIDFMLSDRRDTNAAYRFLRKALRAMSNYPPSSITTDKLASYPKAIRRLQKEGLLSKDVEHRTSKYLNNIIEADHGALKRVIRPTRGFQTMETAAATLKGFEVMRMIRRGHCILAQLSDRRNPSRQSALRSCGLSGSSTGFVCPFQVTATVPTTWARRGLTPVLRRLSKRGRCRASRPSRPAALCSPLLHQCLERYRDLGPAQFPKVRYAVAGGLGPAQCPSVTRHDRPHRGPPAGLCGRLSAGLCTGAQSQGALQCTRQASYGECATRTVTDLNCLARCEFSRLQRLNSSPASFGRQASLSQDFREDH